MNPYILLAKQAVENYVKERKVISPAENLGRQAGVFVTIENQGQLRGCMGTYSPTKENIGKEIVANAIAAATEDYRFDPIEEKELSSLSYIVYILNEPELVKDVSELDPKKYGIIIKSQGFSSLDVIFNPAPRLYQKSGLLLPDLEGVDTVEKQISIACQKGGIDSMKEQIVIYKFTVEKYEEKEKN